MDASVFPVQHNTKNKVCHILVCLQLGAPRISKLLFFLIGDNRHKSSQNQFITVSATLCFFKLMYLFCLSSEDLGSLRELGRSEAGLFLWKLLLSKHCTREECTENYCLKQMHLLLLLSSIFVEKLRSIWLNMDGDKSVCTFVVNAMS